MDKRYRVALFALVISFLVHGGSAYAHVSSQPAGFARVWHGITDFFDSATANISLKIRTIFSKDSILLPSQETSFVQIKKSNESSVDFIIVPVALHPVTGITDVDFDVPEGQRLANEIFYAALKLSQQHENADFQMHIFCKDSVLQTRVILYPASTLDEVAEACSFCEPRQLRGVVLAENEEVIAFEKSTPAREPIDFLIAPKLHVVNYKDPKMSPELFVAQLAMAQKLARNLVNPSDVELWVNNGENAGQIVFHTHMHFKTNSKWKCAI